jgi:hypothetical protein
MMEWIKVDGVGSVAFNVFSPGELEAATGLTADMQRVWRRRGHLPARDGGRASFDAREAAAIAVRLELARFGIPPSDTLDVGDKAAGTVLHSALLSRSQTAELRGPIADVARVAALLAVDDALADSITASNSGGRYLWASSLSRLEFVDDIATIISQERFAGITLLDLTVIGVHLADRASKPLFLIDVGGA